MLPPLNTLVRRELENGRRTKKHEERKRLEDQLEQ
jgi:hypothetical protein